MKISYALPAIFVTSLKDSCWFVCLPEAIILKSYDRVVCLLRRLLDTNGTWSDWRAWTSQLQGDKGLCLEFTCISRNSEAIDHSSVLFLLSLPHANLIHFFLPKTVSSVWHMLFLSTKFKCKLLPYFKMLMYLQIKHNIQTIFEKLIIDTVRMISN